MKKIMCLSTGMSSGGAERQLSGLAVMLKKHGYDVEVAWFYKSDFFQSYLETNNVETKHLFTTNPLLQILKVAREILVYKPDIVIAYMEGAALIASAIRFLNKKFVLIASERNVTWEKTFKRRMRFFFYTKTDYIVPNSYTQAKLISERYPNLSKKIVTISNYTDLTTFSPSYSLKERNYIKIIVVARVNNNKNTLKFIKAIRILANQGYASKIRVDWFGNPHSGEYYDDCIKEIGSDLANIIEIHPPQKDILSRYRDSDIFCLPSLSEGFPNSLSEAMCCGLPVACGNVCDNPQIVRDGIDGVLFNPLDVQDIAIKLRTIIDLSSDQRAEMGRNSRHRAEDLFNHELFLKQYIKLIEQL